MPDKKRISSLKSLDAQELWQEAFSAFKLGKFELAFYYIEQLRCRFTFKAAEANEVATSPRSPVTQRSDKPVYAWADTFISYYESLRRENIDYDDEDVKRAYIRHADLLEYMGSVFQQQLDSTAPDFNKQVERIIRYALFKNVMAAFLPSIADPNDLHLKKDPHYQKRKIDSFSQELMLLAFLKNHYPNLNETDEKAVLAVLKKGYP